MSSLKKRQIINLTPSSPDWRIVFERLGCIMLVSLVLTISLAVGSFLTLKSSENAVEKHVSVWEEEIAKNLLLNSDLALFEKVKSQIPTIAKDVARVDTRSDLPFCDVSQTLPITLYGTPSGALTVCRTYQGIIREGLSSSVFLILTFIGLSFLFWIDRRNQMEKSRLESTYQTAIALEQLARQVAHDIRSPVGALQVLSSNLAKLADTTPIKPQVELLNHATLRIQKIADDLLLRENSNDKKLKTPSLPHTLLQLNPATVIATVRNIIQEKQLLLTNPHSASLSGNENRTTILDLKILDLSNATIDHSSKSNSDSDLGRVLSNLIQNALEVPRAEGKSCLVDVELDLNDPNGYIIRIKDNGLGIDKSNSRHLGRTGFSFGKIRGVGLGVSHARRWVQERRGQLTFKTAREVGTEVTLTLPR